MVSESLATWDLEDLMRDLAKIRRVEATFTEQKSFSFLKEPLVSSGTLSYRSPGYLLMRTLQPQPQTYELEGGCLSVDVPGEPRKNLDLDQYPPLRALVESIRSTLAGDLRSLQRYYRVSFSGTAGGWTLRLEPSDEQAARLLTSITIGGRGNRLLAVDAAEANGDKTQMTITPRQE